MLGLGHALFDEKDDEGGAEEGHAVKKAEVEGSGEAEVDGHHVVELVVDGPRQRVIVRHDGGVGDGAQHRVGDQTQRNGRRVERVVVEEPAQQRF